jgi:penicillin-binding protein 2
MFGEEDIVKSHRSRGDAIGTMILLAFVIVLVRLWYLQVIMGKTLLEFSLHNQLREDVIRAPRGMIYSRDNQLMVDNIPRFDVFIIPQYVRHLDETVSQLARMLSVTEESILKTLKKNASQARWRPVVIKKNLTSREVALIETANMTLPGVVVDTFTTRRYLDNEAAAHVLGYVTEISQEQLPEYKKTGRFNYRQGDFIGQFGLEKELDLMVRGDDGMRLIEVDAFGRRKRDVSAEQIFGSLKNTTSVPGNDVMLTIDHDMQLAAFNALEGKDGSAVALDVNTGEVLAMVSRPGFDPSAFSIGIEASYWNKLQSDPRRPLSNHTIQEHYPPGSTMKPITALAALEEGIITEKSAFNCNGSFRAPGRTVHCWEKKGHGMVDTLRSIKESCDVFYYNVATQLDIDVLSAYATKVGMGRKTGIGLAQEQAGFVPTREWKLKKKGIEWVGGETLSCAIGQSFMLATPLQLAVAYSAIANGGKVWKPQLVKKIFNKAEVLKEFTPQLLWEFNIRPKSLEILHKGLYQVVNERKGTAWWFRGKGTHMAGKTGTAQVMNISADKLYDKCEKRPYEARHHALFVAYAPYEDPKIAVSVVVEHGCHGSSAAAPVAAAVVTAYLKKYMPDKYEQYLKEDKILMKQVMQTEKNVMPVLQEEDE